MHHDVLITAILRGPLTRRLFTIGFFQVSTIGGCVFPGFRPRIRTCTDMTNIL